MTQYTKPTVLPAWGESAGGADVLQPTNAEIQAGWPLSNVPPSRKRFNWILKYLAQGVRYMMQMGIPVWDSTEDYPVNSRVLGSNGKTYKAILTSTNQDPVSAPTYWTRWGFTLAELDAEGTTPAQFDNSLARASTAFVQRAIGGFGRIFSYSTAGQTIPASQANSHINIFGTCSSITMPLANSVLAGSTITFDGVSLSCTVNRQGANVFFLNSVNPSATSLVIGDGESATFVSDGTNSWFAMGSAVLKYSSNFQSFLGTAGYQKLPGGFIRQWGTATTNASGYVDVTFPIAFPTQVLSWQATPWTNSGDTTLRAMGRDDINNPASLTGCRFTMRGSGNVNLSSNFSYEIIGK